MFYLQVQPILKKEKYNKPVRKYESTDFKPELIKYGFMPPHTSMFSKKSVYSSIGSLIQNIK